MKHSVQSNRAPSVAPAPLDTPKLRRHWPEFESQRKALVRIIQDVVADIQGSYGGKYRCSEGPSSEGFCFYVIPQKGKVAKVMRGKYLWVMGGIGLDHGEVYGYAGLGWTKSHSNRIPDRVRPFLMAKGFEEDFEPYGGYDCEEYYCSKLLSQLAGSSTSFEDQSKRICRWMNDKIRLSLKQLYKIEKCW